MGKSQGIVGLLSSDLPYRPRPLDPPSEAPLPILQATIQLKFTSERLLNVMCLLVVKCREGLLLVVSLPVFNLPHVRIASLYFHEFLDES